MVDGELEPTEYGKVDIQHPPAMGEWTTVGEKMNSMKEDVQRHGEVHAQFDGYSDDVEVRLGTSLFDFRTESIKVFDGDQYHVFNMEQYQGHYVPMRVFH